MATITTYPAARFAPLAWVGYAKQLIKDAWTRRAVYNSVIFELSALSDRELADIGIARGDFHNIAADAAARA